MAPQAHTTRVLALVLLGLLHRSAKTFTLHARIGSNMCVSDADDIPSHYSDSHGSLSGGLHAFTECEDECTEDQVRVLL